MVKRQVSSEDIKLAAENLREILKEELKQSLKNGSAKIEGNYIVSNAGVSYYSPTPTNDGYVGRPMLENFMQSFSFELHDEVMDFAKSRRAEQLKSIIDKAQQELNDLEEDVL